MSKILNFDEFLFESDKIYQVSGDPYQYKVVNGVWMTKGPKIKDWKSLENNKKATDILDARHPEARSNKVTTGTPKVEPQKNSTSSGKKSQSPEKVEETPPAEVKSYKPGSAPSILVCAHAGTWDGPGASRAENCLKNIESNIKAGTGMIEIDIQITSDGVPVLFHDASLDSKTNGRGKIQGLRWEQVKSISYKSDPSQKICSLADVINLIKKYRSKSILQLDKCDASELSVIHKLGLVKGIEKQIVAKGTSYSPPSIVNTMGIKWMPILPGSSVGKMTSKQAVDTVVAKVSPGFFEYQFSDSDSYIVNGYMSDALRSKNVSPMVVAVGGTKQTNGISYRGDSKKSWQKIINEIRPSLIMTNRPNQLKSII